MNEKTTTTKQMDGRPVHLVLTEQKDSQS